MKITTTTTTTALEQHFTADQLAKQWHTSGNTVRRMFFNVPGVLELAHAEAMHKRGYRSMRIPASVAERVYREHLSH